jgi:predicted nucleic acid-binding protein
MPDLATLPRSASVFVDTNIFYLHYAGRSVSCSAFMGRVASGEIAAYVNTQVLSDLLHKLMLAEACGKGLIPTQSAVKLRKVLTANRAVATTLTDCQTQFENTLAIGLKVLKITETLLVETKIERTTLGLMTGDSIHLGNMRRHSAPLADLVTHDGDFAHVPGLNVWQPLDVTH